MSLIVWSEKEGEVPSKQIVLDVRTTPFDGQAHFLYHTVLAVLYEELPSDAQHWTLHPNICAHQSVKSEKEIKRK